MLLQQRNLVLNLAVKAPHLSKAEDTCIVQYVAVLKVKLHRACWDKACVLYNVAPGCIWPHVLTNQLGALLAAIRLIPPFPD
jgi:hypothetical protein